MNNLRKTESGSRRRCSSTRAGSSHGAGPGTSWTRHRSSATAWASTFRDQCAGSEAVVKTAREDAAKRLTRELERSVSNFAREAETVLAEQLARIGDAGAQRMERRFTEVSTELERLQQELHADIDTQRGVLETRLRELGRELPSANF